MPSKVPAAQQLTEQIFTKLDRPTMRKLAKLASGNERSVAAEVRVAIRQHCERGGAS